MPNDDNAGILFVLVSKTKPGRCKIGVCRGDLNKRINNQLDIIQSLDFKCEWAGEVKDCEKVEKAIKNAFSCFNLTELPEWYNLDAEKIIPLLKLLAVKEVTETINI